ncbi:MAG: hypothetical protein FWG04_00630 [Desulfovibrionaceae bacterium]|nr:hypothetical protein [Desulfovibrionaceae bacterium]
METPEDRHTMRGYMAVWKKPLPVETIGAAGDVGKYGSKRRADHFVSD